MGDVIIYHNPDCGTSRNTLRLIRNAGIEPHVIEYLKCPPSRALLQALIARMGISARDPDPREGRALIMISVSTSRAGRTSTWSMP